MEYEFKKTKQNFKNGDKVIIGNTNSTLDGIKGVVKGKSFIHISDFYIIELETNPVNEWDCINLTEVCLAPIE